FLKLTQQHSYQRLQNSPQRFRWHNCHYLSSNHEGDSGNLPRSWRSDAHGEAKDRRSKAAVMESFENVIHLHQTSQKNRNRDDRAAASDSGIDPIIGLTRCNISLRTLFTPCGAATHPREEAKTFDRKAAGERLGGNNRFTKIAA
ncbi:MAG TPA: hypothetical protein VFX76_01025, partial [Roseiflexaceae bacterium]|nr:hypothetical protein [Roseiflexaceae bacterium]